MVHYTTSLGKKVSAIISTNTDFGNATIIDDTNVDDYTSSIFEIRSKTFF